MKGIYEISVVEGISISRTYSLSNPEAGVVAVYNEDIRRRKDDERFSRFCCCLDYGDNASTQTSLTPRVLLTAIITNLFAIGFGCVHRYMAPDHRSRRPFQMTYTVVSWRESLIPLGVAAGCLMTANLVDILGRKLTILTASAVCIAGLTLIAAETNVDCMYAGLFVAGMGAFVTSSATNIYLSEVSPSAHRGRLMSLCAISITLGELTVTLIGTALPWNWSAIFCAGFFAVCPTLMVFFPESPRWFFLKGNRTAAAESLQLFRGKYASYTEEMQVMRSALPPMHQRTVCGAWKALGELSNLKSIALCSILIVVQQFTGNQILSVYRVFLRGATGIRLNPFIINTITGLSSTIGSIACMLLIERFGRRVLLILSMACMSGSMVTYAAYFQVISNSPGSTTTWLPLSCVAVHNFSFRLGLWQIPNILLVELLPTGARGVGQAVVGSFANLVGFASLKSFFYIVNGVNFSGCFLIYTGITVFGSIFAAIYVFDTSKNIMK